MSKTYYGTEAIAKVEEMLGRPLTYPEKRVVEEEGYVEGNYRDTKGILTAGVGQTGKYMDMSFDDTFKDHEDTARALIKNYDNLPPAVQGELVQAAYRGDLQGSPTFVRLFNEGKYSEAAQEFLDNNDYRASVTKNKKGEAHGVQGRMERVSNAVAQLGMMMEEQPTGTSEPTFMDEVRNIANVYREAGSLDPITNALKGLFKNDPAPMQEYEVQAGDTLSAIAKRSGKSVAEIVEQNKITNPDMITVGQKLIL